jgi:hypothetical protein
MADSAAFNWVASALEARTHLSGLEARGTVRLVLKSVGLDPSTVTVAQMDVVLTRLMAKPLSKRRVDDAEELCLALVTELRAADVSTLGAPETDTAYDVFERLGARGPRRGP